MACELTGCALMLRICADAASLERYMNLGVSGIQLPRAQSVQQVKDVVDATKFAPQGERGLGGTRASTYGLFGRPTPEVMRAVNDETMLMVQIEDARGIAALPEIVEIDEVDAILIGQVDLSSDLGVPGQVDHPSVVAAVEEIIRIAKGAGKPYGVAAATPSDARQAIEDGAGYVLTSVVAFLKSSAVPFLEAVQESTDQRRHQ
jgi:4-hydroxy-2-oxoheptanedioate aldolase